MEHPDDELLFSLMKCPDDELRIPLSAVKMMVKATFHEGQGTCHCMATCAEEANEEKDWLESDSYMKLDILTLLAKTLNPPKRISWRKRLFRRNN